MYYYTILKPIVPDLFSGVVFNCLMAKENHKEPEKVPVFYQEFSSKESAEFLNKKISNEIPNDLQSRLVVWVDEREEKIVFDDMYQRVETPEETIAFAKKQVDDAMKLNYTSRGDVQLYGHKLEVGDSLSGYDKPFGKYDASLDLTPISTFFICGKDGNYWLIPKETSGAPVTSNPRIIAARKRNAEIITKKYTGKTLDEVVDKLAHDYRYVAYSFQKMKPLFN